MRFGGGEAAPGPAWRALSPADLRLIHQPVGLAGTNYYTRNVMRFDPTTPPTLARKVIQPERPHTAMGWEIYPSGLRDMLRWVTDRYGSPAALRHRDRGGVRR